MRELEIQAKEGRINENASIRDRQSIIINAPVERVWEILTQISNWPQWNKEIKSTNCSDVRIGVEFEWHIHHSHFISKLQAVDKPNLFSWTGKSKLTKSIFVWNLDASDDQTIVTVEESVEGFIIPIFNKQSKLHDILIDWLNALKTQSELKD
jgi:uncharacterized protein YndB with AHSA1/START domain